MADNRFDNNNDFDDIFSNASKKEKFDDIYSNSPTYDDYKDISSFSYDSAEEYQFSKGSDRSEQNADSFSSDDFSVKYNSAVQNRRRQEIQFGDVSEMYGDLSSGSKPPKKPKKKGHPVRNGILIVLSLVIIIASCVGFYGYSTVNKLLNSFDSTESLKENEYISDSELYKHDEQINILLVGVDAREGETQSRSDTMMLFTLDNKNGEIKLTSFLRDSYVQIAGRKKEKLNAAYLRGGIQTLTDTLELNFEVDIPYYVVVDFEIFTSIIDELGGIEVDVTEKESYYTYHSGKVGVPVRIEAGENVLLNGEQALWYSRIRYLDSDFMRTQRQSKVISAILKKVSEQKPNDIIKLAEKILPMVKTNMTSQEMMKMGIKAVLDKAYSYPIIQQQIPAEDTWRNKKISGIGDSLVMDLDKNCDILKNFLSEKQTVEETGETTSKK